MNLKIQRRQFLQFAAGGAVGVATSGISARGLSQLNAALAAEEVEIPTGPETWATSVCRLCPAGCGLRIRKIGERAVRIQGNPLHPVNHGGLCPKGVAGLQELYHPDRLRAPRENMGSREKPRWKEVSWDEALAAIAGRLRELHQSGQAHTVVLIDRNQQTLVSRLLRRFMVAYGSPNYLTSPSGLDALQAALYLQQGLTQPVAYDLEGTRFVLSFGVNLLEGWGSPASVMRAFGRWRDNASGRRTKFVQVEPRFSVTAARADEWVAARPGTEAALALGIAYVLITEGMVNTEFVRDHTFGFEDWRDPHQGNLHMGFRSLVLREYRLNDVAAMTGVPAEVILRLAREFGRNFPAVALGDAQTSTLPGNPYAAMAVHSLNALVGSLEVPGGVLKQQDLPLPTTEELASKVPPQPRIDQAPELPSPGHRLARLPQAILDRKPYPVQMLLLHEVDPVFSQPNGEAFRRAFAQVPFIVSFSAFGNESSALADFVLPATTALESWQDGGSPPAFPYAVQSISAPAVAARHHARQPADVMLALARALGGALTADLPFASFEQFVRHHSDMLFAAQTGAIFAPSLEETWNRLLERSGWWSPGYSSADELWEKMKERGGWWEPTYYYGEHSWPTPSGRFEFCSQRLRQWAQTHPAFGRAVDLAPEDDRVSLPHQPPLAQSPAGFPLLLLPMEILPLSGGQGAHLPYLQQIAGGHLFAHWDSWLEVHPETARKYGIGEGDLVWVESRRGRVQVRARLYAGERPDVVHLPLGYGQREGSAWARHGVNPLCLIEERYEPVAGLPQTRDTYVKVYRS